MRIWSFLTCNLTNRFQFLALCKVGTNGSRPLHLLFFLDGSQVGLRIQCLDKNLDTEPKAKGYQAKGAYSSSSNEKLLSEPAPLADHAN